MNRTKWFIDLETKEQMNSAAIGIIEVIIGDLNTTLSSKANETACVLRDLNHAWNMKKTSAPTEVPKEISHLDCNIDLKKVESLLDFPLIERGPACKTCDCFGCNELPNCHILFPTTQRFCEKACVGTIGVGRCEYSDKESAK